MLFERMELVPFLNLNLRLGEGTGAAMLMHLVDDALAVLAEMVTFGEAGVAERTGTSAEASAPTAKVASPSSGSPGSE